MDENTAFTLAVVLTIFFLFFAHADRGIAQLLSFAVAVYFTYVLAKFVYASFKGSADVQELTSAVIVFLPAALFASGIPMLFKIWGIIFLVIKGALSAIAI